MNYVAGVGVPLSLSRALLLLVLVEDMLRQNRWEVTTNDALMTNRDHPS